jgi:hypothetical protein
VNESAIDISWFDTSAGGLLVPEGIIGTVVDVSALSQGSYTLLVEEYHVL